MIVNTLQKIEDFKYSYFILNKNQYRIVKQKFIKTLDEFPHACEYCILGWKENKSVLYSIQAMRTKTFPLFKQKNKKKFNYDLSFLDPYISDDKSIFLQSDKVVPSTDNIDQLYAIDHIWLAYVYTSKGGIKRMCVNKNLFGSFKLIGSRDMNINEILLSL
tara:strand:- start:71795 stop:72277 length:483 start_codon:yes stop_codon:yes gene_type:complete